eukprot:13014000-Alexandrium_andersonii.AAC.1
MSFQALPSCDAVSCVRIVCILKRCRRCFFVQGFPLPGLACACQVAESLDLIAAQSDAAC